MLLAVCKDGNRGHTAKSRGACEVKYAKWTLVQSANCEFGVLLVTPFAGYGRVLLQVSRWAPSPPSLYFVRIWRHHLCLKNNPVLFCIDFSFWWTPCDSGRTVTEVPVVRIYGSTPAGQKACLHLHQVIWCLGFRTYSLNDLEAEIGPHVYGVSFEYVGWDFLLPKFIYLLTNTCNALHWFWWDRFK